MHNRRPPPLRRTDRVEWRIQCIRFSLPLLLRTSTGVVPVVLLLNSLIVSVGLPRFDGQG